MQNVIIFILNYVTARSKLDDLAQTNQKAFYFRYGPLISKRKYGNINDNIDNNNWLKK